MLRFDDIVFGPIKSRRLGSSLGINLLPRQGKMCNFDCIYCECGWNSDGREGDRSLPTARDVEESLCQKLISCKEEGIPIDSITFSGNGEPTLNPEFPRIIDIVVALRNKLFPAAKITVLSNATRISDEKVREALLKVDRPVLKLDAPTDEMLRIINKPASNWTVSKAIEGMKLFEGKFVLQTMFLKGADADMGVPANLLAWMDIVREVKPKEIMVYTIDRETPMKGLGKYSEQEMKDMLTPLLEEGFNIMIRG